MIYVLVSGGLDSMMAACLLREKKAGVVGLHLLTGYNEMSLEAVERFSRQAGLPLETLDCRTEFDSLVIDYFVDSYRRGETPNPCIRCNTSVKFGIGLDYALRHGAEAVASGHYSRITGGQDGPALKRGVDRGKDQSYFLAFLSAVQLARICFPVGGFTKQQVRTMARERGLTPIVLKESQDICFIPPGSSYGELVHMRASTPPRPGRIEDMAGNVIGSHQGLHLFTVGQRRGINCPAEKPYYVAEIDIAGNRVRAGFREQLYVSECRVRGVNWLIPPDVFPAPFSVKVRYRHAAVPALIIPRAGNMAVIQFQTPQFGITPGQGAVFYDQDTVVGAGIITHKE